MLRLLALSALSVVVGTAAAQNAARGQRIAGQVCAACHAADGNSVAPTNPKIAGQFAEYLQKQLGDFKAHQNKKPARDNPIMTPMASNLSDDDIQSVAAYYAGQKLRPATAADKDLAALGQKIWRGGIAATSVPACGGCHGPAGAGIPVQYPRLAGQFAEYVAAQLKGFKDGARSNDPNGIMRGVAARMTEREIQAVAQYAAGLR
ncbi:MAG TPA: c-type cytochrome [Burkholderiales bacterium]|jgi:cytochrome c553|nr:c-type cytochrome [Burkholderiales bacterium]